MNTAIPPSEEWVRQLRQIMVSQVMHFVANHNSPTWTSEEIIRVSDNLCRFITDGVEPTTAPSTSTGSEPQCEYTLRYQHNSEYRSLSLYASSDEDAHAKVQSLKDSLVLEGKVAEKIPA